MRTGPIYGIGQLLSAAIFFYNTVYKQGTTTQSIGKRIVGIRCVRDADGSALGWLRQFVRYVLHILDTIPLFLGFLWPLWDGKRQTFADKLVKSVVIRA